MKALVKNIANLRFRVLPESMIHGAGVVNNYRFLLESQYWSADQLAAYQLRTLRALIVHAYDNSPFYKQRFQQIGLEPGDIRSFDDFRKIPYLTKDDIRNSLDRLKVRDFEKYNPILTRTGGTTGAPITIYRSENTADMRLAVEWRNYRWGGQDYRQRKMSLFPGTSRDIGKEPFFEDPKHRSMTVKTFQADAERMELFRNLYHQYRPSFLMGIVEFYRVLGKYLERRNKLDVKAKALFVQGESVTEEDRRNFERWFGVKIYDFYGMRENVVSATECEENTMHINQEFVYQEFETNGSPAKPGELAHIIGTSMLNYAVPLIRYYTGDMGSLEMATCPCGRQHQTMKIIGGRTRDFISTRSRLIYICHHTTYLLNLSNGIDEIQFYQPDLNNIEIRIVRNDQYQHADAHRLRDAVAKLTNGELNISTKFVPSIPRTRVGKYRFVISEIEPVI